MELLDLRKMYNPGEFFTLAKKCKTGRNVFPAGMEFVILEVTEALLHAVNDKDQGLTLHRFSTQEYISEGST